jgi:hypothetical protein
MNGKATSRLKNLVTIQHQIALAMKTEELPVECLDMGIWKSY